MTNFEYIIDSGAKLSGSIDYDPAYDRLHIVLEGDGVSVSYESEKRDDGEYVCATVEHEGKETVFSGEDEVDSFLDPTPGTLMEEIADAVWAAFDYLQKHEEALD